MLLLLSDTISPTQKVMSSLITKKGSKSDKTQKENYSSARKASDVNDIRLQIVKHRHVIVSKGELEKVCIVSLVLLGCRLEC